MLLRCAIIDDDSVFTKILEYYVSRVDFMELIGKYPDAGSASVSLDFNKTDLLFLDIEMPKMNGIEFLNTFPIIPPTIIVSRKTEYGVDAFNHDSIDYLHKPVSFSRFLQAANKAKKFFEQVKPEKNNKESIYIRQNRIWIRIPVSEIFYIKGDDNDVIIKIHNNTYTVHTKLSDIFDLLPQKDFMQVHRSYIVNLSKIDKIDGSILEINTRTIPVSKAHLKELHQHLNIL